MSRRLEALWASDLRAWIADVPVSPVANRIPGAQALLRSGYNAGVSKPIDFEELREKLRLCLGDG